MARQYPRVDECIGKNGDCHTVWFRKICDSVIYFSRYGQKKTEEKFFRNGENDIARDGGHDDCTGIGKNKGESYKGSAIVRH